MDRYPVNEKPLFLRLDGPEALVLFALLQRYRSTGALEIQHEAERSVLYAIFAALEGDLRAPLEPHYERVLDAARAIVVSGAQRA